jgi:hypothetical protein
MTLVNSLKAEIGDTLIANYNNGIWEKNDVCILIEKSPEYEKCTEGQFFNKTKNIIHGGNIQSFQYYNKR